MDEPSYGLIVEGDYDASVFPELVRKIVSPQVRVEARPCGGVPKLMSRFPGFLREFEHVLQGKPVDKALVVRDCGGREPGSIQREMAERVQNQRFAFPRGVQFCTIQQEMEAWLLADGNAINAVARGRGGRDVPQVPGQPEDICDPKGTLRRLLAQAGLPYDGKVCGEIARRADIGTLRYRCPSFRVFEKKVTDC